ncbi:component of the polarisome [Clydaea vesicula]|uniref:Component of the polarisome n=1 Tax=Clydaea vesicula TaxID=447962 RepID=A0AAD5Y0L0_9FUNG|nr:component of the polarisome [Clydaea vesicula]KAJ3391141.1 component of the polarisome [Lobulomyces angularis]
MQECQDLASQHYELFRPYLQSSQAHQQANSTNRVSAKDKLQRMANQDFINMSVDIYDELKRRKENSPDVPFLPVRTDLAPNKNAARQKLATLPISRFHLLCCDVMNEIEFRFPVSVTRYIQKYGDEQPAQNTRQINNDRSRSSPIPNRYDERGRSVDGKGYNNNSYSAPLAIPRQPSRNRSQDRGYNNPTSPQNTNYRSQNQVPRSNRIQSTVSNASNKESLDNLMSDLGNMMSPGNGNNKINQEEWNREKLEYEQKISDLKVKITKLDQEGNKRRISELEKKCEEYKLEKREMDDLLNKMTSDFSKLKEEYECLQDDYENQKAIANDIRMEASNLLIEIKNLQQVNDELSAENNRLKSLLGDSGEINDNNGNINNGLSNGENFGQPTGLRQEIISKDRIDDYQSAMSNFLNCASGDNNTSVLVAMKDLVIACKCITEDSEYFKGTPELEDEVLNLKDKISDRLGSLMVVAKNHATNFGRADSTLLDDPASNLTTAVFDLIDLLNGENTGQFVMNIDELKDYLEIQTESIVQAIQSLLLSMRKSQKFTKDFLTTVDGITSIVDEIVITSRKSLKATQAFNDDVKQQGEEIILDLKNSSQDLKYTGEDIVQESLDGGQCKSLKQKMASCSYEIAKFVKELVNLIE